MTKYPERNPQNEPEPKYTQGQWLETTEQKPVKIVGIGNCTPSSNYWKVSSPDSHEVFEVRESELCLPMKPSDRIAKFRETQQKPATISPEIKPTYEDIAKMSPPHRAAFARKNW